MDKQVYILQMVCDNKNCQTQDLEWKEDGQLDVTPHQCFVCHKGLLRVISVEPRDYKDFFGD